MNILFVGALSPMRYGAAMSWSEILSLLVKAGHQATALVPTKIGTSGVAEADRTQHAGMTVCRFPIPFFETLSQPAPNKDRRDLERQIVAGLEGALERERFDLILVGKESLVPGVPAVARQADLPFVVAARGGIQIVLRPDFPRHFARQIVDALLQADLVVACAAHLEHALRAAGVVRTAIAINGIDTARFRPGPKNRALLDRLTIPDGAIIVGHVSTLESMKRPLDVVESAAIALRANPALLYVIVGGNDASERAKMETACDRHGITDRFRFAGWQDFALMPDYMRLMDLTVHPSESEGLSRAHLETMASGGVLIASGIPAAREVIDDGVDGFLCGVGDVGVLTATTLRAADDAALRRRIGVSARKKMVERLTHDGCRSTYESLFERTIAAHHATGKTNRSERVG